jgi:hypothetical protein
MELGAITLMLDFDPSLLEITGVTMPDQGDEVPWFEVRTTNDEVRTNVLNIGWVSLNPVNVTAGQTVLLIHSRLKKYDVRTTKYEVGIRFSLNDNPLSELADGRGNVLDDAKLSVADASSLLIAHSSFISVYPNPAKDLLNVEFVIDNINIVANHVMSLEIVTMHGVVVAKQNVANIKTGLNKTTMDLRDLPNGAYLLKVGGGEIHRVIKVVINR